MNLEETFVTLTENCKCDGSGIDGNPPVDPALLERVPGRCLRCLGSRVVTTKMSLSALKELLK